MARAGIANGKAKMFGSRGKDKGAHPGDAADAANASGSAAELTTAGGLQAGHAAQPAVGAQATHPSATAHEVKATDGPRAVIEQDNQPKQGEHGRRGAAGIDGAAGAAYAAGNDPAAADAAKRKRPRLDVVEDAAGRTKPESGAFQGAALGFIEGVSRRAWAYADAYPHTVLYGFIGFVLAVLILVVGLWHTIIIAVFVGAGAALGHLRDGRGDVADVAKRFLGGK